MEEYILISFYDKNTCVDLEIILKGTIYECLNYINQKHNKNFEIEDLKESININYLYYWIKEYDIKLGKYILSYCENIYGYSKEVYFYQTNNYDEIIDYKIKLIKDFENKRLKDHTIEIKEYETDLIDQKNIIIDKIKANYGYDIDFDVRKIKTKFYFDILYSPYNFKQNKKEKDEDFLKRVKEIVSKDDEKIIQNRINEWKEFLDNLTKLNIEEYKKELIEKDMNNDDIVFNLFITN